MEKGTVIYLGAFELPDKNAAAHRVLNNGKIFRELGYKVVFIDIDKSLKYSSKTKIYKKIVQGFEYWSLPYPASNLDWLKYLTSIDFALRAIKQYSDVKVIIAYNYQAIALYKLKSYCKKNDMKIYADCTEWYSTKGSNISFKIIKGLDSLFRMRYVQKRLDGLLVISKYLENFYSACKNVINIPPLVDLDEEKWNTRKKCLDRKIRFVYSGRPGLNKDKIEAFIDILYELQEYSNYIFNIIGMSKVQYLCYHPDDLDKLTILGDRVKFWGRISHIESLRILQNSDFSICIRENSRLSNAGFPTKFVESISCGVPIITTRTSNLDEFMIDGENGYFISLTDREIDVKILKMVMNKSFDEINIMKNHCRNFRKFDFREYIDCLDDFLNKSIDSNV